MARKKMVTATPGAIGEIMKARNWTQAEMAKTVLVDEKTLRRIDRGEKVKEGTLEALALALRIPIENLISGAPDTRVTASSARGDNVVEITRNDNRDEITFVTVPVDELRRLLEETQTQRWIARLRSVTEEERELLKQLEASIIDWKKSVTEAADVSSLSRQLEQMATGDRIENLLDQLAKRKIRIYVARCQHWTREDFGDPYGGPTTMVTFDANHDLAILIYRNGGQVERLSKAECKLDFGTPPPASSFGFSRFDGQQVVVNGVEWWTGTRLTADCPHFSSSPDEDAPVWGREDV